MARIRAIKPLMRCKHLIGVKNPVKGIVVVLDDSSRRVLRFDAQPEKVLMHVRNLSRAPREVFALSAHAAIGSEYREMNHG